MRQTLGYVTEAGPPVQDPLLTLAALARTSGDDDPYLAYEQEESWFFARGALARITVGRTHLRYTCGTDRKDIPWHDRPLSALAGLLTALPVEDWRVYGTACFELAHAQQADTGEDFLDRTPHRPLLHLFVPHEEVRITPTGTLLRASDPHRLRRLAEQLRTLPAPPLTPPPMPWPDPPADPSYTAAVRAAVDGIQAGALQKVILSRRMPVGFAVDFPATYVTGRRANSPARSFLLHLGETRATGFSPETVVEVTPDGTVRTQPLAGTRARPTDPCAAAALREVLRHDGKEIVEHAISVRAAYEELAALGEPGSTHVTEYMTVKERGSVQHLASTVEARLPAPLTCWDALAALFPAVTASGIPKAAAYPWIRRLEGEERGLYAGAVLTAASDGSLDAALVLRTVFQEGDRTWVQAGAGIVADSRPERETEETREKLASIAPYLVPRPGAPTDPAAPAPACPAATP